MTTTARLAVLGALLAVSAVGAVALLMRDAPAEYVSFAYEDPQRMPDIRLTDPQGAPFVLSEQSAPVTLVYFGYTHCPDVCPLTLGELSRALEAMPEARRDDVRVLFVTVDPERDTPEVMGRYITHFDDSFVALSGAPEDVQRVLSEWAIPVDRAPAGDGSYFVSHPAGVNVLDGDRRLRLLISTTVSSEDIAHDLQLLLDELS